MATAYDGKKFLYKFTLSGGRDLDRSFAFSLPEGDRPGRWMPEFSPLDPAQRINYYGLLEEQLID